MILTAERVLHHLPQCIQDGCNFSSGVSGSVMNFGDYEFLIIIFLFFGYGGSLLCRAAFL